LIIVLPLLFARKKGENRYNYRKITKFMKKVLIIFGSTSGNTELVAWQIAESLEEKQAKVKLIRAELAAAEDLDQEFDLIILAASTYGHGILQDHMLMFTQKIAKHDFKQRNMAVVGLGDSKYDAEYHIEAAPILEEFIKESNGNLIQDSLRISKSPIGQMDKVTQWADQLFDNLSA
jgi:flavodoxin